MIVQDGAPHCRVQKLPFHVNRFGVSNVLVVVGSGQIDHFARIAQANGRECFNLSRVERQDHFVDVRERTAFTLRTRLALGQVVQAKNHVLGRNGDRLAGGRRKNVVRRQHQYASFDLRFR